MPRQKSRVRIGGNKLEDTISKAQNGGKIGIFTNHLGIKKEMPDVSKTQDFPHTYNLRSRRAKFSSTGSVLPRIKYEQVKQKEIQVNMSGFESSKINNFEFQGEKPLVYNPFAMNAGSVSEMAGYNAGGAEEYSNIKQIDEVLPVDYELGKKSKVSGFRMIVNPEKEPPVLNPGGRVKVRSLLKIK